MKFGFFTTISFCDKQQDSCSYMYNLYTLFFNNKKSFWNLNIIMDRSALVLVLFWMCSSSKFHLEHQNIQWAIYEANYHPCLPLCPLNPQPYWVREQHLQTKSSMEEGASLNHPQPTTFTWWYLAPSLSSTVWGNVYPVEFEFEAHTGYEFEAHRELHLRHTESSI